MPVKRRSYLPTCTFTSSLRRASSSPRAAEKHNSRAFAAAKRTGTLALTSGLLLWLLAFTTIGGEWFLMWQSRDWNGQQAAFRMFTTEALILILLLSPEAEPSL